MWISESYIHKITLLLSLSSLSIYIYTHTLVGGLEDGFYFPIYWECHHPKWRTPSFFRGVGSTTNQYRYSCITNIEKKINIYIYIYILLYIYIYSNISDMYIQYHPKNMARKAQVAGVIAEQLGVEKDKVTREAVKRRPAGVLAGTVSDRDSPSLSMFII